MRRTFPFPQGMPTLCFSFVILVLGPLLWLSTLPTFGHAQVAPTPGTGGLNTQVTKVGNVYEITQGTRAGSNLFHSFETFSVDAVETARFQTTNLIADVTVGNILGRVTGGTRSNILGAIDSAFFYPNANLFLMNPAGFLFGPNATVNVGGMVAFTSADYLTLADGVHFNAIPNAVADTLLSASPVAAFGFLGSNPGAITVQGSQFSISKGQGISLVGGDIEVAAGTLEDGTIQPARLYAPGGQINLASVASPGEVLATNFLPEPGMTRGIIKASQGSTLDVSSNAAGTVRIRGGQFVITDATLSADTGNVNGAPFAIDIDLTGDLLISTAAVTALTAKTTGSGDAGEIRISTQNIDVTATGFGDFTPFSVIDTHTSASGKAGAVSITTTDDLTVTGDPADFVFALDSGTTGPDGGQGGNVTLNAKNIDIQYAAINTGDFVAVNTKAKASGSGGNLTIMADSLKMTQSFMVTDGFLGGRGGDLMISARDVQINEFSALSTTGNVRGGTIQINADHLMVDASQFEANTAAESGGGIIFTGKVGEFKNGSTVQSSTFGSGTAGKISFTATDRLTFSDDTAAPGADTRPTGLFTTAVRGAGDAAEIIATTPLLEITGGARFDATTRTSGDGGRIMITADVVSISGNRTVPIFEGPIFGLAESLSSGIYSRTVGSQLCTGPCGNAGTISITTGLLHLDQTAQINSNTRSTGIGGDIMIAAGQSVTLNNGSSVSASSTGPGNTGNIQINAGNQFTMTNSTVTTEANQASGGIIKITTTPSGTVQLTDSTISASVLDGAGGGGSVNIDPQFVILQNSQILAKAVQGSGGNISITTNLLLPDANSVISASSQFGVNGTVTIQSPNDPAGGKIQPLGKTPLLATSLLNQRCAALAGGEFSSFTVAGRDSLPTEPGSWLASPLYAAGVDEGQGVRGEGRERDTHILSLRQIAPAGFLTQAFAMDWSASCQS